MEYYNKYCNSFRGCGVDTKKNHFITRIVCTNNTYKTLYKTYWEMCPRDTCDCYCDKMNITVWKDRFVQTYRTVRRLTKMKKKKNYRHD